MSASYCMTVSARAADANAISSTSADATEAAEAPTTADAHTPATFALQSVAAQLESLIAAKTEQIGHWESLLGDGAGDEDGELSRALESARSGLGPLIKIASLPEATQDSVVATLRAKGITPDRLFDILLFDDAAAAAARLRLRRERLRLATPWVDVWSAATLVNALGQEVAATQMLSTMGQEEDKPLILFFGAGRSEGCQAFMPRLLAVHAALAQQCAPPLMLYVSHDRSEAEMVRFMRNPLQGDGGGGGKRPHPMPWLAAPFGSALHRMLVERFHSKLRGLPTLLLLTAGGVPVSNLGRADAEVHGAERVWEAVWERQLAAAAPMAESPSELDIFEDAGAAMEACFERPAAADADDGVPGVLGGGSGGAAAVLLFIGTSWSDDSVALETALGRADIAAAVAARGLRLAKLNYETGQRWLMTRGHGALHHGAIPNLALLSVDGERLLGEWNEPAVEDAAERGVAGGLGVEPAAQAALELIRRV